MKYNSQHPFAPTKPPGAGDLQKQNHRRRRQPNL